MYILVGSKRTCMSSTWNGIALILSWIEGRRSATSLDAKPHQREIKVTFGLVSKKIFKIFSQLFFYKF